MFHLSRTLGREYVQQKFHVKSDDLDKMKDDLTTLGVIAWRINLLAPFPVDGSRIRFNKNLI